MASNYNCTEYLDSTLDYSLILDLLFSARCEFLTETVKHNQVVSGLNIVVLGNPKPFLMQGTGQKKKKITLLPLSL